MRPRSPGAARKTAEGCYHNRYVIALKTAIDDTAVAFAIAVSSGKDEGTVTGRERLARLEIPCSIHLSYGREGASGAGSGGPTPRHFSIVPAHRRHAIQGKPVTGPAAIPPSST